MKTPGLPHERPSYNIGRSLFPAFVHPALTPHCLFVCLALTYLFFPGEAISSNTTSPFDFSILQAETAPLTHTITTDQEAISVFSSLLEKKGIGFRTFPWKPSQKPQETSQSDELIQLGIQFIREIAIFHWASNLYNILENEPLNTVRSTYQKQQGFISWIKSTRTQPELSKVLSLMTAFLELSGQPRPSTESWDGYHDFAEWMLVSFPDWTGSDSAWVSVAQQEGGAGILHRLESYWKVGAFRGELPETQRVRIKEAFIGRFLQQLVLPISKAHLRTSLFELQTQSERLAWESWRQVQVRKTRQEDRRGLTRLCGTWQWLIHNHQNHGDHKTVMVYPPPSQYDRMDPKPAKIQVQGDTVYIRWEFPNGIIQEESLLLTEKDRMLSGNFVNNMGPNGNITGRRIAACKSQQDP